MSSTTTTTTTLGHLVRGQPVLKKLYDVSMSPRLAYKLGVWINAADVHLTEYQKQHNKILETYSQECKEDTSKRLIPQKDKEAYVNAMSELTRTSVTFIQEKVPLSLLEQLKIELKPSDMAMIAFLVHDDSPLPGLPPKHPNSPTATMSS